MKRYKQYGVFQKTCVRHFSQKQYFPLCLGFLLFVAALFCAAESQAATVTLTWDQSPDPVTGYRLFYGEQSVLTNPSTEIDAGNVLQTTLTTLTSGTTYYFAFKAYNAYGQSGFSNEVTYTVPACRHNDNNAEPVSTTSAAASTVPATTSTIATTTVRNDHGANDQRPH